MNTSTETVSGGTLIDWIQRKMRKDRNDQVTRIRWKNTPVKTELTTMPVEVAEAEQTIEILYAKLNLPRPGIVWLTSPLALITAAVRCTNLRGSWLSSTASREIGRSANPIVELIRQAVLKAVFSPDPRNFGEIEAANSAGRALSRHSIPGQAANVVRMLPRSYLPLDELLPYSFSADAQACIEALDDSMRHDSNMHRDPDVRDSFRSLSQTTGGFICFENIAFVVQTRVVFEELKELHNSSAPILLYPDNWGVYASFGRVVPEFAVRDPQDITIADINNEKDRQTKAALLEKFGMTRYWKALGAYQIQMDEFGTLFRIYENGRSAALVRVINSTPEADGTYKEYFLRVPPQVKTAREAVAWTFGMQEREFRPRIET